MSNDTEKAKPGKRKLVPISDILAEELAPVSPEEAKKEALELAERTLSPEGVELVKQMLKDY